MGRFGRAVNKYFMITLASLIFGIGISLFIDPASAGTLFLLLNIPIMILGIWKFGLKFIVSTLFATFMVSFSTNLFTMFSPLTQDPFMGAVFGGVLVAVGIGLVLRVGATTGGTDIVVKCLKLKKPYLKTGTIFLLIDGVIICIGGIVFQNMESVLYSVISAAVTSKVLDLVLYGNDEAKMIYIISNSPKVIAERILKELDTGVTYLTGTGAYKKEEKQVIFCVVRKQLAYKVEEVVKQEDSRAFMIVSNATEIYGEGYKSYFGEKL